MTAPPSVYRQEVDVVSIDHLFLESQKRRYASWGIAYLVLLNGIAALILLASVNNLAPQVEDAARLVDAMLVFGCGAALALASSFFAYLRRTVQVQTPEDVPSRNVFWWLSVIAAMAGAAGFVVGLNMTSRSVIVNNADFAKSPPKLEQGPADPPGPRGEKGDKGDKGGAGPQGERGEKGTPGVNGEKEDPGPRAETGGPAGSQESAVPRSQAAPSSKPSQPPDSQTGRASWYAFNSPTASGEQMDASAMTAAHPWFPFGTKVLVENLNTGRSVVVRINDRGPFIHGRIIDLSKAAAASIGMIDSGVAEVRLTTRDRGAKSGQSLVAMVKAESTAEESLGKVKMAARPMPAKRKTAKPPTHSKPKVAAAKPSATSKHAKSDGSRDRTVAAKSSTKTSVKTASKTSVKTASKTSVKSSVKTASKSSVKRAASPSSLVASPRPPSVARAG